MKPIKDMAVLSLVARFIIPFIIVFAFYIQFHGDYGPGGGFQAGLIMASAFILFCLVFGLREMAGIISFSLLQTISALGLLLYAGVGVATLCLGGNFLDYDVLQNSPIEGQHLGIFLVELGVGLTVFSVTLMIFLTFIARRG